MKSKLSNELLGGIFSLALIFLFYTFSTVIYPSPLKVHLLFNIPLILILMIINYSAIKQFPNYRKIIYPLLTISIIVLLPIPFIHKRRAILPLLSIVLLISPISLLLIKERSKLQKLLPKIIYLSNTEYIKRSLFYRFGWLLFLLPLILNAILIFPGAEQRYHLWDVYSYTAKAIKLEGISNWYDMAISYLIRLFAFLPQFSQFLFINTILYGIGITFFTSSITKRFSIRASILFFLTTYPPNLKWVFHEFRDSLTFTTSIALIGLITYLLYRQKKGSFFICFIIIAFLSTSIRIANLSFILILSIPLIYLSLKKYFFSSLPLSKRVKSLPLILLVFFCSLFFSTKLINYVPNPSHPESAPLISDFASFMYYKENHKYINREWLKSQSLLGEASKKLNQSFSSNKEIYFYILKEYIKSPILFIKYKLLIFKDYLTVNYFGDAITYHRPATYKEFKKNLLADKNHLDRIKEDLTKLLFLKNYIKPLFSEDNQFYSSLFWLYSTLKSSYFLFFLINLFALLFCLFNKRLKTEKYLLLIFSLTGFFQSLPMIMISPWANARYIVGLQSTAIINLFIIIRAVYRSYIMNSFPSLKPVEYSKKEYKGKFLVYKELILPISQYCFKNKNWLKILATLIAISSLFFFYTKTLPGEYKEVYQQSEKKAKELIDDINNTNTKAVNNLQK